MLRLIFFLKCWEISDKRKLRRRSSYELFCYINLLICWKFGIGRCDEMVFNNLGFGFIFIVKDVVF